MKYTYYYQTKDNENRTGEIKARDRADAYTQLRKQGIRPYRVVGDDPAKWRRYLPMAAIVIPLVLFGAIVTIVDLRAARSAQESENAPLVRQQIVGDESFIVAQIKSDWQEVLPSALDRYLAAYAQPGWEVSQPVPPETTLEDLKTPLALSDSDRQEVRQLKRILLQMRKELAELVANGGTLADYAAIITDRQETEVTLRQKAISSFMDTPPSLRRKAFASLNICLRDRNIAPLPESLLGASDF